MYEKNFKRYEQKYLLNTSQMKILLEKIKPFVEHDNYFKSEILNIYFDNENSDLIINSLEKPIYKVKVRARSYKIPKEEDNIFLELKTKYKGVVGKRRTSLTLKEYNDYIYKYIFNKENQIMKEIDYIMNLYKLKPSVFISYNRLSYKAKQDTYLRITFDTNLKSRNTNLNFNYNETDKTYKKDLVIAEVKTLGSLPKWFIEVLEELKIYPTSFSKYGEIYKGECIKC